MGEPIDLAQIAAAARALEQGALVAFPTETVYGLGADAENPAAVAAIYAAKGRPQDHPVIVHLAPDAELDYWAADIPDEARQLAAAFWPGPLTLILKRAAHIPAAVSGGQDTVGLRCPSHPVAIALLQAFKGGRGGIAAPSANKFGNVSPTTAQHVRDEFGADGADRRRARRRPEPGRHRVDHRRPVAPGQPRPGAAAPRPGQRRGDRRGDRPAAGRARPAAPRASGTLESHYAPHTPVAMQDSATLKATLAQLQLAGRKVALIHYSDLPGAHAAVRLPAQSGRLRARAICVAARDGQHRRRPDPGRGAAARRRLAGRQRPLAARRPRLQRHRPRPAQRPGSPLGTWRPAPAASDFPYSRSPPRPCVKLL